MTDVRAIIAERDALRYLLEEITSVPEELTDLVGDLTAGQRRALGVMLGQPGRPLSRSQMLAAMMVDRPYADWPTPGVIDAQVCLMRKRLGPASPVKITTHWGIGYSATIEETPKGDA